MLHSSTYQIFTLSLGLYEVSLLSVLSSIFRQSHLLHSIFNFLPSSFLRAGTFLDNHSIYHFNFHVSSAFSLWPLFGIIFRVCLNQQILLDLLLSSLISIDLHFKIINGFLHFRLCKLFGLNCNQKEVLFDFLALK